MQVRFSNLAEKDIIENYLYGLRNFGEKQADRYDAELRKVVGLITDSPKIARERDEYYPPVRIHHHAKHYVVYRVDGDQILIVRILRDSVDLTRHLQQRE